jgi:hypothetical protein
MLNFNNIEKIFHYSTESKDTEGEKMEKNNRRFETICIKVAEVREAIYESKKGVLQSIGIVNERYASILSDEEVQNGVNEIRALYKVISSSHIDLTSKASIIKSFEFKDYKKLLNTCKLTGLKTISRLTNMKIISTKFLNGELNKKTFSHDLKEQIKFFGVLLTAYEDISKDNCYVYLLRYDLKTIKKRKYPSRRF